MFTPLDPTGLDISANERDLLRDLFTYLDYFRERNVKRMTRTNEIPGADMQRLSKLLEIDPPQKDDWQHARQHWINFIDTLALRMQLVSYDLKGEYRGYTSSEPSFIGNFIVVNDARLQKFLELSAAAQEKNILETLIHAKSRRQYDDYGNNEFYRVGILSQLDAFHEWGSATGLMPTLKFPGIRQFLLDVLKNCPAGQWLSAESLVAYLKANHPYFLIPKHTPKPDKWGHTIQRYGNFHEGKDRWNHNETPIPDDAPDAFERVEGRYVERFLENIPLLMRFVDVAYDPAPYVGPLPSRGTLKAFRVNERFLRLMRGEVSQPKVTVQPNFDVIVESDFYPAKIVRQIAALGEQVSSPNSGHGAYVGIFQLNKAAVAAEHARQPDLDVLALLRELTGRDLPPNVQIELEEWAGHADQFTLYEGFALLENVELALCAEKFIAERISPTLSLARSPEALYTTLETDGRVPLRVQHPSGGFAPIAESAVSVFPKESAQVEAPKTARQVKVSRLVVVSYKFPDEESFTSTQKMLAELRCPFQSDPKTRIISLQQKEQGKFDEALEKLRDRLIIEIE